MKIIVLGDTHGRDTWKEVISQEKEFDKLIFLGDYFDSYDLSTKVQVNNFLDIIEYRKTSDKEVIQLIGNHDISYHPSIGNTGTSGYQSVGKYQIEPIIDKYRHLLKVCYKHGNFLFTHAGVSQEFMDNEYLTGWNVNKVDKLLNALFKYQPRKFVFNGRNCYGDDTYQTPLWIRPRSLMKANKNSMLKINYIQIVGHTEVNCIDGEGKSTGGRYYFIDALATSGEYLIITDGIITVNKIKK